LAWLAVTVLCLGALPAQAVTILEKGNDQPIRGFLVDQNEFSVTIREVLPGGATKERVLVRSNIEEIFLAVDYDRLASLRPENPQAYREYAEDLREKREDPDARATAIRLYLIAAYLDADGLGKSSLLGMTALARSPDEERRFRAMAYLLDPEHDRSILRSPAAPGDGVGGMDEGERTILRSLLRLVRSRKTRDARNMLIREQVRSLLRRMPPLLELEELEQVATPGSVLAPSLLRRILKIELALAPTPRSLGPTDSAETVSWSRLVAGEKTQSTPTLTLETVTEFDPRKQFFHEGGWVDEDPSAKTD
jgi:hypothetical protein